MSTTISALVEPAYHTELIDGREIQKPLPKNLHAFTQSFLMGYLLRNVPSSYAVLAEMNVLCGDDRLVPDLLVVKRGAQYRDGDLADPPALIIEILSPGQTVADLLGKADRFMKAGTPLTWVIWPEKRKAWTYTQGDLSESVNLLAEFRNDEGLAANVNLAGSELWACLEVL